MASARSRRNRRPPPPPPPPPPPAAPPPPLPEAPADLAYVIVNEAGASVYSASPVGREEFPNFDATLRGTISIGRRLQDPLAELVKIDPQHVGVGLYQHDVSPKQLRESLDGVIESCVNTVGVDLNTASVPLLRHVSGLNQLVARDLVEYRKSNGPFRSREQLKQVPGIGEARFTQAAGFLRILGGDNPLDSTWVHPESYPAAQQVLNDLGAGPDALAEKEKVEGLRERLKGLSPEEVAARLQVGVPTVKDIFAALAKPGRGARARRHGRTGAAGARGGPAGRRRAGPPAAPGGGAAARRGGAGRGGARRRAAAGKAGRPSRPRRARRRSASRRPRRASRA